MKNLITLKIELTPSEANTLCTVLAKAIDYYTYRQDTETVNPIWFWGLMNELSSAMYKQNTEEDEDRETEIDLDKAIEKVCSCCEQNRIGEMCDSCPVDEMIYGKDYESHEEHNERKLISSMRMVCKECGARKGNVSRNEICDHCPVQSNAEALGVNLKKEQES